MSKVPGQNAVWKNVNNLRKTFPDFLNHIRKYHTKALDVLAATLDNPDASANLRHSAATKYLEMYLKFQNEFKDASPGDFEKYSEKNGYTRNKPNGKKSEGNGLISLTYDETGTDD